MISRFVVAAIFLTRLARDFLAQQVADNKTKLAVAPRKTSAATTDASGSSSDNKASELSDRERLLLDRIDRLEQRLAELESRSAGKPRDATQPDSANMAA